MTFGRVFLGLLALLPLLIFAQPIGVYINESIDLYIGARQYVYFIIENSYKNDIDRIEVSFLLCKGSSCQSPPWWGVKLYDASCNEIGQIDGKTVYGPIKSGTKISAGVMSIYVSALATPGIAYLYCPRTYDRFGVVLKFYMKDGTMWERVVYLSTVRLIPQGDQAVKVLALASESGKEYVAKLESEMESLRQQVQVLQDENQRLRQQLEIVRATTVTATRTVTITSPVPVTQTVTQPVTQTVEVPASTPGQPATVTVTERLLPVPLSSELFTLVLLVLVLILLALYLRERKYRGSPTGTRIWG